MLMMSGIESNVTKESISLKKAYIALVVNAWITGIMIGAAIMWAIMR